MRSPGHPCPWAVHGVVEGEAGNLRGCWGFDVHRGVGGFYLHPVAWWATSQVQDIFLGPSLLQAVAFPGTSVRSRACVKNPYLCDYAACRQDSSCTFTFNLFCSPKSIQMIFMNQRGMRKESYLDPSLLVLSFSSVFLLVDFSSFLDSKSVCSGSE